MIFNLRLTLLFYINIKQRLFKKFSKKAKKKYGFYEENFLLFLECRLVSAVYRSSMILDMFDAINFVKNSNVKVNNTFISYINFVVPIMELISFRSLYKGLII